MGVTTSCAKLPAPIGLIGAGRMGAALAARLRTAGHRVTVHDRDPTVRARLAAQGFETAATAAAAAAGAWAAFICVPDAPAVASVVEGPEGILQATPPRLVIDVTSSLPAVTERLAARLRAAGSALLDAPVSGGVAGAMEGRLTSMVGGDPELLELARPFLETYSSEVLWIGGSGAGHAVKAVNNMLSAISLTAGSEALVTAECLGLPEVEMVAVLNRGRARSQNSEVKFPRDILSGTYGSGFTTGLMHKDVTNACAIAAQVGRAIPLGAATQTLWSIFKAGFGAGSDFTEIHRQLKAWRAPGSAAGRRRLPDPEFESLELAVAAACLLGAAEMLAVTDALGIQPERVLAAVNSSSGRSEATRADLPGAIAGHAPGRDLAADRAAAGRAAELARDAGVPAPLIALTAELLGALDEGRSGQATGSQLTSLYRGGPGRRAGD